MSPDADGKRARYKRGMQAAAVIPVANDNLAAEILTGSSAKLRVQSAGRGAARTSRPVGLLAALLYHTLLLSLAAVGLRSGVDPQATGVMLALAALGGGCALGSWGARSATARAGRNFVGGSTTAAAIAGLFLLLPDPSTSPLGDPVMLAILVPAALGALFRLPLLLLASVGAVALMAMSEPVVVLPLDQQIQLGAILSLCVVGAHRSRSTLAGAAALGLAIGIGLAALRQGGMDTVQALAAVGMGGAAMASGAAVFRSEAIGLRLTGMVAALGAALVAQAVIRSPSARDGFMQAASDASLLAAILVSAQGVVLAANLVRWHSGRIGWLGVALPQLALAALATAAISPEAVERWTRVPDPLEIATLIGIALGACVLAVSVFGVWRNWERDRPVRTGAYALVALVQLALLWPVAYPAPAIATIVAAAVLSALCGVWLMQERRDASSHDGSAARC